MAALLLSLSAESMVTNPLTPVGDFAKSMPGVTAPFGLFGVDALTEPSTCACRHLAT
jgi:hypothetical protein